MPVSAGAVEQVTHCRSLVRADRREHLEHLSAEAGHEPFLVRALGELLELEHRRLLVDTVAVMEGDGQPLQLGLRGRPGRGTGEVDDLLPPAVGLPVELEAV